MIHSFKRKKGFQINTEDIMRTLANRGKTAELFYVDNEPCLNVRHWTDQEQSDFCAEFGVSCSNGIICALHQPYAPRTIFADSAEEKNNAGAVCPSCGEEEIKHILPDEAELYRAVFVCGHSGSFTYAELNSGEDSGTWENAGTSLPERNAVCEVKGKYTPDSVAYPTAKWDGEKWSSAEWRGMVAIEEWRYV